MFEPNRRFIQDGISAATTTPPAAADEPTTSRATREQ